jgi:tetratricopeptide (TPR) repeat protein
MNNLSRATLAGGVLLAVVLAYLSALSAPFHFDDYAVIVDNPAVHGLSAWWASMPGIRPLLKLSYAANRGLSPGPWGFHLFNLLVHAANTLLVWAVANQWQRTLAPSWSARHAGAGIALLFALHPAATEAVTYVSGRSVSLMALFYLASLWMQGESPVRARPEAWRIGSALLFAAAMGVRETAVTLPIAILMLAWFAGRPLRAELSSLRWHGVALAGALVAAMLAPGYDRFFHYSLSTRGLEAQVLGQTAAHAHLFLHSLIGLRTNLDPALTVPAGWGADEIAAALSIAAAIGLAVISRPRLPWLGFAIAWYLLQLAPSNSLMPRFDLANDRHLYLATVGAAFAFVGLLQSAALRRAAPVLFLATALLLAAATHRRNLDYRSELSLWQATAQASPGKARAWANLGWARQEAGDIDGARAAYECALALQPAHQQALINLSLLPSGVPSGRHDPACPGGLHRP